MTGHIALATTSSGVATSILPRGRTAHSRFKIVIDGDQSGLCGITRKSAKCKLSKEASLIIWDEAPMEKRWDIESVDHTLRDVLDTDEPFRGKIVLFCGDFRQMLLLMHRETHTKTVDSSLVWSYLWPLMRKLKLTHNMRANGESAFRDLLLRVGNGTDKEFDDGKIEIPVLIVEDQIIQLVYSNLQANCSSTEYITNKGILAARNHTVDMLNSTMVHLFPGYKWNYTSYDKAIDDKHNYYPEEFLNTLTTKGLPPNELILKLNCAIMLLRNLSPLERICNGTRLVCRGFRKNLIDAEITLGHHAWEMVLIHWVPL